MANFTNLDSADISALADLFELGRVESWSAVEAGTINSNYELTATQGRYFLRVNEGKDEEGVRYEAELVTQLADLGVPTPKPVGAHGQRYLGYRDHWVTVFPFIAGCCHVARSDVTAAIAADVGQVLGALHDGADRVQGLTERYGIYTTEAIAERLGGLATCADPDVRQALVTLEEELAWLVKEPTANPIGIIHGDLFRDNVLFWEGGDRGLAALLDFEQASLGDRVYDLAVCVNAWCYDHDFDRSLVKAMVDGYAQVRGPVDHRGLWTELRRSAWRFTITRITDVHLRGIDDPDKDFRRYLARLQGWRQLGLGGLKGWFA